MTTSRTVDVGFGLALLALVALSESPAARAADDNANAEQKLLRSVGIDPDTANLLKFLMSYPDQLDPQQLDKVVQQLGSKPFAMRERISRDLAASGHAALPALQRALQSPDKEIARRARACIEAIKKRLPRPDLEQAMVRLVLRQHPPGSVAALLRYLPFAAATDEELEEDIWFGLDALAGAKRKVDPALREALKDPIAIRRATAACILGRRSEPELPAAVRKLLKDSNPTVRLRAAQGLLAGKGQEALPTLIPLLDDPSIGLAWQAEELLHWAAGESAPTETVGAGDVQSRQRCRKAWEQWWAQHGAKLDLTSREHNCRRPGLLLVSSWTSDEGRGHVWLCGCDGKPRWQVKVARATDFALLKNNRILMAQYSPGRIVELSLDGKMQWQYKTDGYTCRRLPNGNTLFLNRQRIGEVTPDGQVVNTRKFEASVGEWRGSSLYVWLRLRNGRILCSPDSHKCKDLVECDPITGREQKTIHLQKGAAGWCAAELADGHYLLAQSHPDRVFEVASTGRIVWQHALSGVTWYPIRLRNHNTLLAQDWDPGRLLEVDRTGKLVWETFCGDTRLGRIRDCLGLVRLGFHGPRPADFDLATSVPYRLAGLKNKDLLVRRGTLSVLEVLGPRPAALIPKLIEGLLDPNPAIRSDMKGVLIKIGPPATPALVKLLQHPRPEMRATAAELLGECRGDLQRILPALLAAVDHDKVGSVREAALRNLGAVGRGRKETVARLLRGFKDKDQAVRQAAIQMMAVQGPAAREAVPALLEELKDRDWNIRWSTLGTLGYLGRLDKRIVSEILPVLIRLLDEKEEARVRRMAAQALGTIGKMARDAVPDLLRVAQYKPAVRGCPNPGVSGWAAWAVEEITKDKGSVPSLADIIQDRKVGPLTRRKALQAIQKLGPQADEAVPALIALLKEAGQREDLEEAASALAAIGSEAVIELTDCVKSSRKATRCFALRALQKIGPNAASAIPTVAGVLADADMTVRGLAWKVLPQLGPEAVKVLIPLAKKGDTSTRCRAIDALGEMGPAAKAAIPALREAMKDVSKPVRIAAGRALTKVRP
jgi:HEAT repeat protein